MSTSDERDRQAAAAALARAVSAAARLQGQALNDDVRQRRITSAVAAELDIIGVARRDQAEDQLERLVEDLHQILTLRRLGRDAS